MKIGMEKSKFDGRDDTMKLIEALEGLEMKEGEDFPQGDKTLRKEDHQAFLREFIFEVGGGTYHLQEMVDKDKTIVPPACKFRRRSAISKTRCARNRRSTYAPRRKAGERRRRLS